MNIAMFAWEALEGITVGGASVYASRLAAALSRAGHRVRLFTRLGSGQAMDEVVNGIHVRRCPWDRKRNFYDEIESLSHSFSHYYADAAKTDGPYDVVHCHEWLTVGAGLRVVEPGGPRLAVSFHSTEWGRTGVWPDQGDSARIAALEAAAIGRADAVVAASQWARRSIHDQFHPPDWKCQVVYHGADIPVPGEYDEAARRWRREIGIPEGVPCLLYAGRFSRQGGADLAAAAAGMAAARLSEARFVFAGAGPLETAMRDAAGREAVFLPPAGRAVPPELYQAADAVLAPFRRDHSGRAVLPAWAASKPAIVLKGGVPAEFVMNGTNGWLVDDDPALLAEALVQALSDPEFTAWMGRNGRVAVETAFTWEESARRLLAAYNRRDGLTPGRPTHQNE